MARQQIEPILALLIVLVIVALFLEGGLSVVNLVATLLLLVVVVWLARGLTGYP